jgi:acyl dehydratase
MRSIEEIKSLVGTVYPPSDWFLVDQDRVNQFGKVTFDNSWTHTDPVRAADIGGTTVQGFLLMGLIPHLMGGRLGMPEGCTIGVNLGFDKLRITNAVRVGKRIRLRAKLASFVRYHETMWRETIEVELDVEGDEKPALRGDWIIVYY